MKFRAIRVTRWGWLATTFALVIALLATAWSSRRGAERAYDTLIRGQGDVLMEAMREYFRVRPGVPTIATIDSFIAARADAGVLYVGLLDPVDDTLIEVGTAMGGMPAPEGGGRRGGPGGAGARLVGDSRLRIDALVPRCLQLPCTGRGSGPPFMVGLEFEPVVARELVSGTRRTLVVASVVAAALLAVALLFWRLSIRREQEQQRFEQERRLASLGEMSAVLAHEIRNPLASLKGNAQLLAERLAGDEPDHEPDRLRIERIISEAKRLELLIVDLLDFARTASIEPVMTDPGALLQAAIDETGSDAFVLRTAEAPPWPMDAGHVLRALTNLLRNARQASPEGTPSEVGLSTVNGTLVYRVRDFGPGIPKGDESRIFEPFYTTRTTGTGLGLAVARRIAELHGGRVTASNHPGGGAVFEIALPKVEA